MAEGKKVLMGMTTAELKEVAKSLGMPISTFLPSAMAYPLT